MNTDNPIGNFMMMLIRIESAMWTNLAGPVHAEAAKVHGS